MASATRSGRIYAFPSTSNVLSPKKRCRKNVVTPEKAENTLCMKNLVASEKDDITSGVQSIVTPEECETTSCIPISGKANSVPCAVAVEANTTANQCSIFEYELSCEYDDSRYTVLSSPDKVFRYSSASETESEVSVSFGGWITSEINEDVGNKENIPPSSVSMMSANLACARPTCNFPTIPRYPLVARNSYGGIRDCLPPEQLTRWIHATKKETTSSSKTTQIGAEESASHNSFTADQLFRMEQNRIKALERLGAKKKLI